MVFIIYARKDGDNRIMQKAVHQLSNSHIHSYGLDTYEKKAIIKACSQDLMLCPQCEKPVDFVQGDFEYFKHKKNNEECELSLSDEQRELRIEKVQAALAKQLQEIYFDDEVKLDVWFRNKRYHIIGPSFKIRIFNEIHPYHYLNDDDINVFVTDYNNVFEAETLRHRDMFFGYNINKDVLIMYNFKDEFYPITFCPVDNFYIDENGRVYKKNFIAESTR